MTEEQLRAIEARAEAARMTRANLHAAKRGDAAQILADMQASHELLAHARDDVPLLAAEVRRLQAENDRLRQDRADALSVRSREGLLSSEWVARTGKAERERDEARARAEANLCSVARIQGELDEACAQLQVSRANYATV